MVTIHPGACDDKKPHAPAGVGPVVESDEIVVSIAGLSGVGGKVAE
jgi:hypothetical protein